MGFRAGLIGETPREIAGSILAIILIVLGFLLTAWGFAHLGGNSIPAIAVALLAIFGGFSVARIGLTAPL